MMNNDIKHALNNTLSSLNVSHQDAAAMLTLAKGGKKVKRKLSVATMIAIALIAISLTAFAIVTLQQYYEKTIEKEGSHGLMKDWESSDHIAFIEMMAEAGIELDESKLAQMRDTETDEETRGTIAWGLIQAYYPARDGILTSVDIIAKEKGPIEYWSLEDRAWFSQMIEKHQPSEVSSISVLPQTGDITKEQALQIAYDYYKKEHDIKMEDYDTSRTATSFVERKQKNGEKSMRYWQFDLWLKADSEYPLGATIRSDGVLESAVPPHVHTWRDDWYNTMMESDFWTVEGLSRFKKAWGAKAHQLLESGEINNKHLLVYLAEQPFGLPKNGDLDEKDALQKANEALLEEEGIGKNTLHYFKVRSGYLDYVDKNPVYKFVYVWSYDEEVRAEAQKLNENDHSVPYMMVAEIDAKSGERISTFVEWNGINLTRIETVGF